MPKLTIWIDENKKMYCLYWDAEKRWEKTIEVTEDELNRIKYETLANVEMILQYLFATRAWRFKQ